jgi:hypothetical protein
MIVPDSLLFLSEAGLEWEFEAISFSFGRSLVHFVTVGDHGTKSLQSQAYPMPLAEMKHSHSKKKEKWMGPKQVWNPAGQMLNPVVSYLASRAHSGRIWVSKDLGSSAPVALLVADHMNSPLGWFHSLPAAFLSRCSVFLASPASQVLCHICSSLL